MWMPAKKLASVSCKARPTARPPMPSAVSSGVIVMPRVWRMIRPPTASTATRATFTSRLTGSRRDTSREACAA
jgi:hypothetical protein